MVIVWKSGNSSGDAQKVRKAADLLRQQYGALVLAVSAAGHATREDEVLAGGVAGPFVFDGWANADAEGLGRVADTICEVGWGPGG